MKQCLVAFLSIIFGMSSGIIIATAILAFITAVGLIPRLTAKTDTRTRFLAIGTAAILGSTMGSLFSLWDIQLAIPKIIIGIFGLFEGIFVGCLAVALAEILNVIPIARSRIKIKKGMGALVFAFAIGKMVGSLYYWFYPGFNR